MTERLGGKFNDDYDMENGYEFEESSTISNDFFEHLNTTKKTEEVYESKKFKKYEEYNPFNSYNENIDTTDIDLDHLSDTELIECYNKAREVYLRENKDYGSLDHRDLYNYACLFEKCSQLDLTDNIEALEMAGSCYIESIYAASHGFSRKHSPFDNYQKSVLADKSEYCFNIAAEECEKMYDRPRCYRNRYLEIFTDLQKEICINNDSETDIDPETVQKTAEKLYLMHIEIDKIIYRRQCIDDNERRMLLGVSGEIAAASDFLSKYNSKNNPELAIPASFRGDDGNFNKTKTHDLVVLGKKGDSISVKDYIEVKRTTNKNYLKARRESGIIFVNKEMSVFYIKDPKQRNLLDPIYNEIE